jgi:hypothetical protein
MAIPAEKRVRVRAPGSWAIGNDLGLAARQLGESIEVADGPEECQKDMTCRLWRKRRREDEAEDHSSKDVAPIDPTEATGSANEVVNLRV